MSKFIYFLVLHFLLLAASRESLAHARPTSNALMPLVKLQMTPQPLGEKAAFTLEGELGHRDYRLGTTFGFLLGETQKFKISGEYLTQKLGYRFQTGLVRHWSKQMAVGAGYEIDLHSSFVKNLEASAFYSHAPTYNFTQQIYQMTTGCEEYRRQIAGSHAGGGTIGATFSPWRLSRFELKGNYDYVDYQRSYQPHKKVTGFGGTVNWFQGLGSHVDFKLGAELRHPFNSFDAALNWRMLRNLEGVTVGLFGSYTQGKHQLANNGTAGVRFSCNFGDRFFTSKPNAFKEKSCKSGYLDSPFCSTLISWVSRPAVYVPEVLAITDEIQRSTPCPIFNAGNTSAQASCQGPPASTPIPFQFGVAETLATYDLSPYFTNPSPDNPVTFSLDLSDPSVGDIFSIDPNTGLLTVQPVPSAVYGVRVLSENACGLTVESFDIIII